jgi:hypothetical protein
VRAKSRWSSQTPLMQRYLWAKPSSRKPHFFSTLAEPRLAGMTAAPTRWRPSSPRATSKILLTAAMAYPRLQYSTLTQYPRWQPAPELRSRPQACSTRACTLAPRAPDACGCATAVSVPSWDPAPSRGQALHPGLGASQGNSSRMPSEQSPSAQRVAFRLHPRGRAARRTRCPRDRPAPPRSPPAPARRQPESRQARSGGPPPRPGRRD